MKGPPEWNVTSAPLGIALLQEIGNIGGFIAIGGPPSLSQRTRMLFMVIEKFRNGGEPVYARFREMGRMMPEGLEYVDSWVTPDREVCYQVMRCAERSQLDGWIARWEDLVNFEVVPVITSAEAAAQNGSPPG